VPVFHVTGEKRGGSSDVPEKGAAQVWMMIVKQE
jgi:hypothetical protein